MNLESHDTIVLLTKEEVQNYQRKKSEFWHPCLARRRAVLLQWRLVITN